MALTLRTDPELEAALASLSASEGASRQEIIRRAVMERLSRSAHEDRVQGAGEIMLDRWGDVLRRLGSA